MHEAVWVQAAAKAKKVADKEKKAREGLKKLEVSLCFVNKFWHISAVKSSWLTCAVCNAVTAATCWLLHTVHHFST